MLRLKRLIDRGREISKESGYIVNKNWTDGEGVDWVGGSIVAELIPTSQQRIPLLMARQHQATGPLPVVFVLHGTSRSKSCTAVTSVMARYAKKGWAAISFDSRYHGERSLLATGDYELSGKWEAEMSKGSREAPYQQALVDAFRGSGEQPFIFDAAFDLMRCIDFVERNPDMFQASRIGATGISLGGMIVWLTAVVDPRLKVAAPAIGVQGFQYAIDSNAFGARVDSIRPVFEAAQADLGRGEIDGAVVAAVWDKITPGLREYFDAPKSLGLIAPRPLLLLQGGKDPRCPIPGVQAAFDAAQSKYASLGFKENIRLFVDEDAGHQVTPLMWEKADQWFEKHL